MPPITVVRSIDCTSDVCSMWSALTDTERLNRAIGNNRLSLTPLRNESAARYLASTKLGGFNVQYEERPFEWVYLKKFQILRRMRNGPISALEVIYDLATTPMGGTKVNVTVILTPRLALLSPVVRISAAGVIGRMEQEIRRMDGELASGKLVTTPKAPKRVDRDALARAAATLEKLESAPHVTRLIGLLGDGSDLEVSRLRPYALADSWGIERRLMLSTCLRAVKAGLLELRWDIVCPSCRTVSNTIPSLSSLTDHGTCQLCDIQFGLELDQAVEATFAPARAVRKVDDGPYCIGGPARTPHVVAQTILPSGVERSLFTPEEQGAYRLFVRGGVATSMEVKAGAPSKISVEVQKDSELPMELTVAPHGEVVVTNRGSNELHAKLERIEWLNQAATAREVTTMAEFRRDFSSDVLRPGTTLKVSRMGLFFSDLSDSTRLYATTGDAAAFKLVQEHFDLVVPILEKHGGALVKTMGDAVMAVFSDELSGLRASRDVLAAFKDFRLSQAEGGRTNIKLGFYAGPCFVLTANGVLDYFGQTVNIAARLQAQAKSAELVIEERFADEAIRAGALPAEEVTERYEATLKGVTDSIRVARVKLLDAARAKAS